MSILKVMMKAFLVIPNDFDIKQLTGKVNLNVIGSRVDIYSSLDQICETKFDRLKSKVVCVEFIDPDDLIGAIMSACNGDKYRIYSLKVISTIRITDHIN